ncbi:unnamed protein product, partial [Musa acuminata subsp. burmannicoides]
IFLCFRVYDGGHHPAALPLAELNTASDRRWKVPRGGGSVDWSPPLPSFVPSPSRPDPLLPVRLRPASSLFSPRIAAAVPTLRSYTPLRIWGFGASSLPRRRSVEFVSLLILISRSGYSIVVRIWFSVLLSTVFPVVLSVAFSAI